MLRHKHGLDDVNWNDFLQSLAGIKAATLVMEDYQIKIHVPQLNPSNLVKGDVKLFYMKSSDRSTLTARPAALIPMFRSIHAIRVH